MPDSQRSALERNGPVTVRLVGEDGNSFAILGRVSTAMMMAGWTKEEIDEYVEEATKGDYYTLLAVTMEYTIEPDEE